MRSAGPSILLLEEKLAATSDGTSSLGGDETALLSAGGVSSRGGGVTDVLMVTTTMGMLHRIHGNTTHLKTGIDIDDNYSEFVKLLLCIHCWRGEIISSFQGD